MIINETWKQDVALSIDDLCARGRYLSKRNHRCYVFAVNNHGDKTRELSAVKHVHVRNGH